MLRMSFDLCIALHIKITLCQILPGWRLDKYLSETCSSITWKLVAITEMNNSSTKLSDMIVDIRIFELLRLQKE